MSDPGPLAPNRIHSLPVLVRYHLPNSSQHFTTLFSAPQQVYVHPSAGGQGEEAWGSIYLKTVIQGVLMASPELHPSYASTADLSLYILDPRETYLKKSRQSPFPAASSSSAYAPSSPIAGPSNPEVWTGKGLISWALEEPGEGKNLITGRLTRQLDFGMVSSTSSSSTVSPMEALAMAGDAPSWGIEVSLGLRSGSAPFSAPQVGLGIRSQLSNVVAMESGSGSRRSSFTATEKGERPYGSSPLASTSYIAPSTYPAPPRHAQSLPYRAPTHPPVQHVHRAGRPLSPSRVISSAPQTKARDVVAAPAASGRPDANLKKAAIGKRKKPTNDRARPRASSNRGRLSARQSSPATGGSSESEPFPDDIPAKLYDDPESLTKEQAERLLESPAFLSMLSKLTGQPIAGTEQSSAVGRKRPRGANDREDPSKRVKVEPGVEAASTEKEKEKETCDTSLKCYNCGRTKSAVWRMKVMDDGKSVKVCNACGLYWNKMRTMRPPPLWEGVDEEVMRKPRDDDDAEKRASRIDHTPGPAPVPTSRPIPASSPAAGSGFKRTLSTVVNQDAMRIAAMRTSARPGPSTLKQSFKPSPFTSPVRSTSALPKARNGKWASVAPTAASSPGDWYEHTGPPVAPSDNLNPHHSSPRRSARVNAAAVHESPNTAIRRILGTANTSVQSLDLPLSDDSPNDTPRPTAAAMQAYDWTNADLTSFFDVESYAMHNASAAPARSGNGNARPTSEKGEVDDDVMSQLFHRTSSAMMSNSSPAPFDFSQLPPSSPPMSVDLPHSALLLSSPDLSPMDQISPAKSTGKSMTPNIVSNASTPFDHGRHYGHALGVGHQWEGAFDSASFGLDDLWGMDSATVVATSSVGQADAMLGTPGKMGDDIFAMFDKPHQHV